MSKPISIDSSGECEKRAAACMSAVKAMAYLPLCHPVFLVVGVNPIRAVDKFFHHAAETSRRLREGAERE